DTSVAAGLALLKGLVECLAEGDVGLSLRAVTELLPLEFAWLRVLLGGISSLLGSSSCSRRSLVRGRSASEHVSHSVSHCRPDGNSSRCRSHLRGGSAHGSSNGSGCSRGRSGHRTSDGSRHGTGRGRSR
ncbi:hypothetical protein PMAYCL1PPCAC_12082, partial [Pristionchus mayeri]